MLNSIRNIFSIPDLRKRVIFTLLLLAVYRIGAQIPNPGISGAALAEFWEQQKGTIFGFIDLFSGGNMSRMTIFALGIMPYISSSIILQLLQVVWPYLEKLSKEGEMGRKKITQYTRYGTILICFIQAYGISLFLQSIKSPGGASIVPNPGLGFQFMTVLTLTTGTVFIMWLGEQISERGIGNGISLIIFAGIVVELPQGAQGLITKLRMGDMDPLRIIFLLALLVAAFAFIVFVERGQRRIPVSYAKRVVGRKIYGGQATHLPLRVNTGGVIPIIFAASVITIPSTVAQLVKVPFIQQIAQQFGMGMPLYSLFYIVTIIFFTYFYVSIIFNPNDVADNLRKYGGFIPGIRPGKNTSDFIDGVLSRLTLVGAIYLAMVAVIPEFMITGFKVQALPVIGGFLDRNLPNWFTQGLNIDFYFGGTSILIVVGVAMDLMQQIEAQLVMRHYDGFMRRGRIKGRR
ncbi:MAG: preprotein translocase subunit SecY [Acidobacteria bacterium]|nr:preprotein translocase subunit SecY [Acidobacteriota bacterium]MCG2815981.1 preprotein translocase subunit SecY [Candidatus Aminicenantes bacterium]MBU1337593.1 preprotein translocase subunit SecY [Acidobacteriota bacterium]MBU1474031.1 preprotein translocase subunit SecY [Acidobacteriota bacterium]MBU2438098.1 preprotein translocase subunit SecY [Acidobacteriota bacterium]